jgi:hypothetical protein
VKCSPFQVATRADWATWRDGTPLDVGELARIRQIRRKPGLGPNAGESERAWFMRVRKTVEPTRKTKTIMVPTSHPSIFKPGDVVRFPGAQVKRHWLARLWRWLIRKRPAPWTVKYVSGPNLILEAGKKSR